MVISFRGTEQVKWKDIATDLNLTPTSLNPERADSSGSDLAAKALAMWGGSKEEMMVHSGFMAAYDAVRVKVGRGLHWRCCTPAARPWSMKPSVLQPT